MIEASVTITPTENGPYLVKGPVTVLDADGSEYRIDRSTIALCRCGGLYQQAVLRWHSLEDRLRRCRQRAVSERPTPMSHRNEPKVRRSRLEVCRTPSSADCGDRGDRHRTGARKAVRNRVEEADPVVSGKRRQSAPMSTQIASVCRGPIVEEVRRRVASSPDRVPAQNTSVAVDAGTVAERRVAGEPHDTVGGGLVAGRWMHGAGSWRSSSEC